MEHKRRNRLVKNPNGVGYIYSIDDSEIDQIERENMAKALEQKAKEKKEKRNDKY